MNFCCYGASSNAIDEVYIKAGEELGSKLAKLGHTVVYGGGGGGMMGAIARGSRKENGSLIGISPKFFLVDGVLFDDCTEFIYTETMRERKQILEEKSDAFIVTPGGIGTFDEFFEIFTLRQLDKHEKPITIYNINHYYDELIAMMEKCIDEKFMKDHNRDLYYISDNADDIISYIENFVPIKTKLSELKDIK